MPVLHYFTYCIISPYIVVFCVKVGENMGELIFYYSREWYLCRNIYSNGLFWKVLYYGVLSQD